MTLVVLIGMGYSAYYSLRASQDTHNAIQSKEEIESQKLSVRVFMDTMEAAYRMSVFTDITMLDTKASNGRCPEEWKQIYQAYWPGTT